MTEKAGQYLADADAPGGGIGARKAIRLPPGSEFELRQNTAKLLSSPEFAAARAMNATEGTRGIGAQLDTMALLHCLKEQAAAVNAGDLSTVEAMLVNQATALQSLFANLVERGMNAGLLPQFEAYLRLGLRAQAQCARTLEVLAAMKSPPVVFARQANIAGGHQQVNNAAPAGGPSRARDVGVSPSKLSEGGQ